MPYLNQDFTLISKDKLRDKLVTEYNDRFYKGYIKGKKEVMEDVKNKTVNTVKIKQNRDVTDPFCMGYEVGYLKQLLYVLTDGKVT